jgi:hypothetical protein
LVEEQALEQAETECLADEEARLRRRARGEELRSEQDRGLRTSLAAAIVELFPGCPQKRAETIAAHAAARGSARIGRSAAGRALAPDAVRLAVAAAVRHVDTRYDELLMTGVDRTEARRLVRTEVDRVLDGWSTATAGRHGG